MDKVKAEIERTKANNIIEEITEAADWCAGMVPVMKRNGEIRICTDFKRLNENIKRERYVIPTFGDMLHKLSGAKVFSKLDATFGFWQLLLDEDSAKLTTFIAPFDRYFYKRLPFGISSAPEIFQRTMEEILAGEENVVCYFDDILIYSKDYSSHDEHLDKVMKKLESVHLRLNDQKTELRKSEIEFLGHLINKDGVQPDPAKVSAIKNMPDPQNVTELRRILGMISFLGRYIPNLSTTLRPMTELLESDKTWSWGESQSAAFTQIKESLSNFPTLAFFDLTKPTTVSSDASSYSIGGVLLQEHDGVMKPVAYCSRTLTGPKRRYAQIEKECLGAVWACEKFERYLIGLEPFTLETDHKPLIPLINTKDLHEVPVRCQRMIMRLMHFNKKATFSPGKKLIVADALSRSPQQEKDNKQKQQLIDDVEVHIDLVKSIWPATDKRLKEIAEKTQQDENLRVALEYTANGWPVYRNQVKPALFDYFAVRNELSVHDGLLVKNTRIVIPESMRKEIIELIHAGHQGITKSRERANSSVWWPKMSEEITQRLRNCRICEEKKPTKNSEPLKPTLLPDRAFQVVGADICEFKGDQYLIVSDYFSRYIEIAHLKNANSFCMIQSMKNIFARHGIPEKVVTDNGRQFV